MQNPAVSKITAKLYSNKVIQRAIFFQNHILDPFGQEFEK